MFKLPESEIRKRLRKLHNYEKILYPGLMERNERIKAKNKELEAEIERLQKENAQIEVLRLQLEELRALKFGRKRSIKKEIRKKSLPETEGREAETELEKKNTNLRTAESYRRTLPNASEITDHLALEIENCPECGEVLEDKNTHVHYREDLHKVEELLKTAKRIVEVVIESGKCRHCKNRQFAMEVPKQKVVIGENVRRMVVYQTVMQGLSYTEVQKSMKELYHFNFSSGEIVNILEGEKNLMVPYYETLVDDLNKESKEVGAHYDETSWKTESCGETVSKGNYCWIKIGVQSQRRLIWFGQSRGMGVAEQLRGEKSGSKGVSDDYGAYRNCFEVHSLCWAHPYRKLRDLAESGVLTGKEKQVCQRAFKAFGKVYKKAESIRSQLQKREITEEERSQMKEVLESLFDEVCIDTPSDPEKLKTLRQTLRERKDRYFTFLKFPWLPLDNNKAERAIRRVVLKRKKSLGCRSQKGADILSVLYSCIFSALETSPEKNFFDVYQQIVSFQDPAP